MNDPRPFGNDQGNETDDRDTGAIIGKCENILIVLMVAANAITGLALIFTAKTFVRQKAMVENPRYG